jgi:hypothetical protein
MTRTTRMPSRRAFLLASGAATAAAIVAKKASAPVKAGKDARATLGYHASEHITNYYRTTKV